MRRMWASMGHVDQGAFQPLGPGLQGAPIAAPTVADLRYLPVLEPAGSVPEIPLSSPAIRACVTTAHRAVILPHVVGPWRLLQDWLTVCAPPADALNELPAFLVAANVVALESKACQRHMTAVALSSKASLQQEACIAGATPAHQARQTQVEIWP